MPVQLREQNGGVYPSVEHLISERKLTVHPNLVPLYQLLGYSDDSTGISPDFGERMQAVYQPLTGQTIGLNPFEIQVLNSASRQPTTILEACHSLGLPEEVVKTTTDRMVRSHILQIDGTSDSLEVRPPSPEQHIEVYLELTQGCNLRCTGCATGVDTLAPTESKNLKPEQLVLFFEKLKAYLAQNHLSSKPGVKIKWAGGEPLMPKVFPLIEDSQSLLDEIAVMGFEVDQVLLTNGILLSEKVVDLLAQYGIRAGVSLWGLGAKNALLRGSLASERVRLAQFRKTIEGIRLLQERGVPYNIIHIVSPANAEDFADFLTAFWDINSPEFVGKNWDWTDKPEPIPLSINLFRPQAEEEIEEFRRSGYQEMIQGLRQGFARVLEMLERGTPVPQLNLDYLRLSAPPSATVCGAGYNYLALGPNGAASCHQLLRNQEATVLLDQIVEPVAAANSSFLPVRDQFLTPGMEIDVANPLLLALMLHGGTGCPMLSKHENGEYGQPASTMKEIYLPLLTELLALNYQSSLVS